MIPLQQIGCPVQLTQTQVDQCLEVLRSNFESANIIYRGKDRVLIRSVELRSGRPIIIKLWARPDFKGMIRRLLHIAGCNHEQRTMMRLRRVGMAVPYPLAAGPVNPAISGYTDVLIMEDLGECESSTEYFKVLIRNGDEAKVSQFEDAMIEMTAQILKAGMLDVDHGFVNTVVQASGRPVRLDFELARWVYSPRLFPGMYGRMLGHTILLHAFAVQPDVARTVRFAERLRERLHPSRSVLRNAGTYVHRWLRHQSEHSGIDTRLRLPWD